jgi:hypothetical protein
MGVSWLVWSATPAASVANNLSHETLDESFLGGLANGRCFGATWRVQMAAC